MRILFAGFQDPAKVGGFAWRQVSSPRHWSFGIETKKQAQREKYGRPLAGGDLAASLGDPRNSSSWLPYWGALYLWAHRAVPLNPAQHLNLRT